MVLVFFGRPIVLMVFYSRVLVFFACSCHGCGWFYVVLSVSSLMMGKGFLVKLLRKQNILGYLSNTMYPPKHKTS